MTKFLSLVGFGLFALGVVRFIARRFTAVGDEVLPESGHRNVLLFEVPILCAAGKPNLSANECLAD